MQSQSKPVYMHVCLCVCMYTTEFLISVKFLSSVRVEKNSFLRNVVKKKKEM